MDKKFIEESFPVKEVSDESAKEKYIRNGHISSLHIWWARRPLSSSRATNYAALISAPKDEIDWVNKKNFIIKLSKWENSLDMNIIEKAKKEILKAYDGTPPKIFNPFSGGGAIPLEALRLGCEVYANDLNPVAVLIERCTLEYPQKYARTNYPSEDESKLGKDVSKWANWVLNETKSEIGKFYPIEKDGSIPTAYIWARTIKCQNPSCNAEIPLMRQFWLAKKKNKKITLKPGFKNNRIIFEIQGQENGISAEFDPNEGTVNKANAKCLVCGMVTDSKTVKKLFCNNETYEKLIAVALKHPKKGKYYRIANENDLEILNEVDDLLAIKTINLSKKWEIEAIPNEPLPPKDSHRAVGSQLPLYNFSSWSDLFNPRQKLVLLTFTENILNAYDQMLKEGLEKDYAKVLISYLALNFDKVLNKVNSFSRWNNISEKTEYLFARQTLAMMWDYSEVNPFSSSAGSWVSYLDYLLKAINNISSIKKPVNQITLSSATDLPYPDNFFDAVFTDPPYYDNIPYSYLSDFFYVWLKRSLGKLYPELFLTPLTPKKQEIVVYSKVETPYNSGKEFFEDMFQKALNEIFRVLKYGGISTIVYAHKTTDGWETVINSLLDSGLVVTASWPISTEMKGRLIANKTASLSSSIYIVARKMEKKELGWFKDVKEEIKNYVPQKLDKLWEEGISGADFFIAAIGSSIEIFGKYKKIMDNEGNNIRANKLLSFVRDVVTDYTVRHILHNGIADQLSPLSKFYMIWRWNYVDAKVNFDEARKIAQSAGIESCQ